MSVRDAIAQKLSIKFAPSHLEVIDESEKHRGHAGWREGGSTHFRVRIAADGLAGLSRVEQHRAVMAAVEDELKAGIHALTIEVIQPGAATHPATGV